MPCSPEMRKKADTILDSIMTRMDSIMSDRDFEEAKHARQAGGVFAPKGQEGKEKDDTQEEPGNLGKKNAS
jgi:hypothetical protein